MAPSLRSVSAKSVTCRTTSVKRSGSWSRRGLAGEEVWRRSPRSVMAELSGFRVMPRCGRGGQCRGEFLAVQVVEGKQAVEVGSAARSGDILICPRSWVPVLVAN
jgi:hypothetical protein